MSTPSADESDDRLKQQFAATATDAAPPDSAFLATLRERSTVEFAQCGPTVPVGHGSTINVNSQHVSDGDHRTTLPLSHVALRALVALAATAAVVMAGFFFSRLQYPGPKPVAQMSFGEVMANVVKAGSYQAEWTRDIGTHDVFGSPQAIRIQATPTHYWIATPQRTYEISESENTAKSNPSSSDVRLASSIDPLQLWEIPGSAVASVLPTEKRVMKGRDYFVYYCSFDTTNRSEKIEALVDGETALPAIMTLTGKRWDEVLVPQNLRFTSFNQPLDPAKLSVPATLTEDGRIGKVTDWQGTVALRPMTSTRWTPVCDKPVLRMGDWLRTDTQGANAVTVQLAPQTKLILGPGSLVELTRPDQITLHSGIAEVTASPKADNFSGIIKLVGPAGVTMDVAGVKLVRANDNGLVTSDKEPVWLAGYKGNAVSESLGSLVAMIDGRRVPLTVGYHKVAVEIRDQIARTTIEESFVNHTDSVLEGQFHFPLPADASISGFGMWIGSQLIEADIVEKQRAREIYETILREKRDPGLLEWTGGNIFKARVYPIPANGEKRIKIVYTQVLPRKGDSFRYSYALQSDLLRQKPLRQLDLEVTVSSTQPLAGVTCPTHLTRNQLTEHAARVEFSAQKYTPARDFEVVVETGSLAGASAGAQVPDVVLISHQRGRDGYFLLQLQPPSEGEWKRDVLPDGQSLNLLVLADTSASMDAPSRKSQAEVLAALLGSLSPKDTFNLAVCDVDCTWTFDKPQPALEKSIAAARELLANRRSLGWTNLDRAFELVAKQVKQGTQVVYLGDGIVTSGQSGRLAPRDDIPLAERADHTVAGDMDGPAFVQRLTQRMGSTGATLHAVAAGNSYDAAVLRGIASIGGGSLRHVSSEFGPQQTAKDLLAEITRPALRNIRLEFSGLRTARVYPRVLPNVPAGTQQIVLGRFQPLTGEQRGEVIVTGTLEGKPVTYRTGFRVQGSGFSGRPTPDSRPPIPDSSFIPRLWARMHLDELLAQGTSQEIQDEVINLSEEFHIITPYTSLLVLETDADRERFKVKRRFQMRDGERFFADARDTAQYQLVQQQMQRAGLWRQGVRDEVLMSLASLGRDQKQIGGVQPIYNVGDLVVPVSADFDALIGLIQTSSTSDSWIDVGGPGSVMEFRSKLSLVISQTEQFFPNYDLTYHRGYGAGSGEYAGQASRSKAESLRMLVTPRIVISDEPFDDAGRDPRGALYIENQLAAREGKPRRPFVTSVIPLFDPSPASGPVGLSGDFDGELSLDKRIDALDNPYEFAGDSELAEAASFGKRFFTRGGRGEREDKAGKYRILKDYKHLVDYEENNAAAETYSIGPLIPISLTPPSLAPVETRQRKSQWPEEAQQIARSIQQAVDLSKVAGGLVVSTQIDEFEPHRGRLVGRASQLQLASAKAWLVRRERQSGQLLVDWAAGDERGVLSPAYELALVRKSAPTDYPKAYESSAWWQADIEWSYQDFDVQIERPNDGQVLLVLKHVIQPHREVRILIDTARHVVLSTESFSRGQRQAAHRASDFVEIAGVWLPQKIEHQDDQGRTTSITTRTFEVVAPERFDAQLQEQLAGRPAALTLRLPLPRLHVAKENAAKGEAKLEDHLVILAELTASQKWPEAHDELARCEKLVDGKSFAAWMRLWLLVASRRNEEARQLLLAQAQSLADKPRPGERELLERMESISGRTASYEEQLAILEALQPIYARLPEHVLGPRLWGESRQRLLQYAGRHDEQLALIRELVRDYPDADYHYRLLANRLTDQGEYGAAYEVLEAALGRAGANWSPAERDLLYQAWSDHMKQEGRWADQEELTAKWLQLRPHDTDPYERHLAALIYTRREAEADKLMAQWLAEGLAAEPLPKDVQARVVAAVETVTGDNNDLANGDVDPRFLPALAELLIAHVADDEEPRFMSEISSDYDVRRTDEFRAAANKLFARLKAEAGTLPLMQLQSLVRWCNSYVENTKDDDWKTIASLVRPRWEAAKHPAVREMLGDLLVKVLGNIGHDERLAFLRLRLEKSDDERRAAHAGALFEALLESPSSAEVEAESLALIDKLSTDEDVARRLSVQVAALYRWTDRMEEAGYELLVGEIERPDKLTRTELQEKHTQLRKQVRSDLAARLKAAARQDGLARWLAIEQLTLEARLERDLPQTVENCWELLGTGVGGRESGVGSQEPTIADQLDAAFRARLVTMLMRLAIRKDAPAAEAERLVKYLDQAIAADATGNVASFDARMAKYVLLVALDKPTPLAEQLAAWSKGLDRPLFWQRTLAYLKAELGELEGAVALVEPLAAADELSAADYRAAAGWYQALARDEKYRAMQIAAWKQMDEWRLRDVVRAHLSPWENTSGPTPGTLDPQLFVVLQALLEKSSDPAQHVQYVRSFYEKSRDFRLIAALADAVVGQSAGSIYRFLKEIDSTLDEIDREATVDELLAHVAIVRERAKSPVDQRALDLLTMLAQERAAEIKNEPGPHVAAAVAALLRASKAEWSPGEAVLFGQLLAELGQIPPGPLSDERIRVLQTLHAAAKQPQDRLIVAHALAESLINDGHRQRAIDVLEPALAEHRAADGGKFTLSAIGTLRLYGEQLSAGGKFVRAEQMVRGELARAVNENAAIEIRSLLFQLHSSALERGGRTSLGEGLALYRGIQNLVIAELMKATAQAERHRLFGRLCDLYLAAHRRANLAPVVKADIVSFSQQHLPTLLDRQIENHQDIVERVERTIRETAGYLPALTFLVTRLENEPAWLVRRGDDGWRHFAWDLGILHDEVRGKLGDLEPRVLAIVLAALRRELTMQSDRRQVIYHRGNTYYWQEKEDEFVRVAEEVLAERRDSLSSVTYISRYLYRGVNRYDRAIEILLEAERRGLIDESGRLSLVIWLQERERYGESIAFLESLVKKHPAELDYRIQLMREYFHTKQPDALAKLLAETDKFFHEKDRWNEEVAAQLAMSTLESRLLEQSVEYLKEAIGRREEALSKQTSGDRTLAQYYIDRAYAYAGLANTKAAVDDACSAAVVWGTAGDGLYRRRFASGGTTSEQVHPLDVLRHVLAESPNLDAYVAELDAAVAKSNEDRPIVRKSLGEVYFARARFDKALAQLKLAVELAPTDGALHAKLVECYDALMQPQLAAQQLFASVELARRDINLWVKLSERLEQLEQPLEAERARTSLVEMLSSETEGHTKLAEIRQSQDRWDEAIDHWRHVARIRKLEPAGLLSLAAAQIHQQQRGDAEKTLKELETTDWPARFHDELRQKQLPKLREDFGRLKSE